MYNFIDLLYLKLVFFWNPSQDMSSSVFLVSQSEAFFFGWKTTCTNLLTLISENTNFNNSFFEKKVHFEMTFFILQRLPLKILNWHRAFSSNLPSIS